jgi:predicted secreted Zn-dependent protease
MTRAAAHDLRCTCRKPLLLLALLAFLGTAAYADTYHYEGDDGAIVFTDDASKIPRKRGKVRRITDEAGNAQPSANYPVSPPPAPPPQSAPRHALVRNETPDVRRQDAFYEVGGHTFKDIRREIYYRSPMRTGRNVAIAWCSWRVTWVIHTRESEGFCEIASVDTRVPVSITMPRWINYASAGDGMKGAWEQYSAGILAHEETHAGHGIAAARDIQRRLPDLRRRSSCRSMQEDGELLAQRIVEEYRGRDVEFDRVSGTDTETITDVEMAADKREGVLGRQYPESKSPRPR